MKTTATLMLLPTLWYLFRSLRHVRHWHWDVRRLEFDSELPVCMYLSINSLLLLWIILGGKQ